MMRRVFSTAFIICLLCSFIIIISSCTTSVAGDTSLPVSTSTLTPTPTPKYFTTAYSKNNIDKQVVIYIVIDDSKSVSRNCDDEARDAIEKIKEIYETLLYFGSTNGINAQNVSIGFGIISSENSELFPITPISELPGKNIRVLRDSIGGLDFLNMDVADVTKSVEIGQKAIETYIEENEIVDAKKLIFVITDGEDDITKNYRYEAFNDNELNSEYIVYYGLYSNNTSKYEQTEPILRCNVLPELVEKWPSELIAQIWDEESSQIGYVDYSAEKEVNWDACSINRFYSRSNTNNDRVYLQINDIVVNNDELIITNNDHGKVVSESAFGFYWIDSYVPQYELFFDTESDVIENKKYISTTINLDIVSNDKNVNNFGIGTYSECFEFKFEDIQIDNEQNNSKPGSDQLTFQFNATLPKGTCEKEVIIPFRIESPGGYTYIEDIISIPLLYKPEIITPLDIQLLPSEKNQEIHKGIYQINVKAFTYQQPKIYFSKKDYEESGTSVSSTCQIDLTNEIDGYMSYKVEYGLKLPDLLLEITAIDHAVIVHDQDINNYIDECVVEYPIQLYSEVIQTDKCGLNELLFVWEYPEGINSRYILGCSIVSDPYSYSINNCHIVENSMFEE